MEESTIAKGIRRLVAVTGEEAFRIQQISAGFKPKIDALKSLSVNELDAALKALGKEIDETTLPLLHKLEYRSMHAAAKKAYDDADKARKAAEAKEALEYVKKQVEEIKDRYITVLPTSNNKAAAGCLTYLKSISKTSVLFVKEESKVSVHCFVSKEDSDKGLKAADWMKPVFEVIGGRGGGKDVVMGSGNNVHQVDAAIEEARKYLEGLKL